MSDNEEVIKVGKDTFEKLIEKQLHETTIEKNEEFHNAVNTFYTLKGEYDEQIKEIKSKIFGKS